MKRSIDDPQGYVERLRPLMNALFRAAHAITGNLELAEYVLRSAMLEAYRRRDEWRDRMSFREGLMYTVRLVALTELKAIRDVGQYEDDWAPIAPPEAKDAAGAALAARLMRESDRAIRAMVLYYGCGLKPGQVGEALLVDAGAVRTLLSRLTARLERGVSRQGVRGKRALEERLTDIARAMLEVDGADLPDAGAMLRAFERDAQAVVKRRFAPGRMLGAVLLTAGMVVFAALFWLLAILMEPRGAPVPAPTAQVEQQAGQVDA